MINGPDNMKSDRNPWYVGEFRLFGDILPFIGFETIEVDSRDIPELREERSQRVSGSFFTMEWLGHGFSLGRLSIDK